MENNQIQQNLLSNTQAKEKTVGKFLLYLIMTSIVYNIFQKPLNTYLGELTTDLFFIAITYSFFLNTTIKYDFFVTKNIEIIQNILIILKIMTPYTLDDANKKHIPNLLKIASGDIENNSFKYYLLGYGIGLNKRKNLIIKNLFVDIPQDISSILKYNIPIKNNKIDYNDVINSAITIPNTSQTIGSLIHNIDDTLLVSYHDYIIRNARMITYIKNFVIILSIYIFLVFLFTFYPNLDFLGLTATKTSHIVEEIFKMNDTSLTEKITITWSLVFHYSFYLKLVTPYFFAIQAISNIVGLKNIIDLNKNHQNYNNILKILTPNLHKNMMIGIISVILIIMF